MDHAGGLGKGLQKAETVTGQRTPTTDLARGSAADKKILTLGLISWKHAVKAIGDHTLTTNESVATNSDLENVIDGQSAQGVDNGL